MWLFSFMRFWKWTGWLSDTVITTGVANKHSVHFWNINWLSVSLSSTKSHKVYLIFSFFSAPGGIVPGCRKTAFENVHLLFEKCPVLSNFSHKSILQTSAGNSNGTFPFCIRALQNICIDNVISYQPRKFEIWKLVNRDRIKSNYLGKWINSMKYPAWNKLIMLQSTSARQGC